MKVKFLLLILTLFGLGLVTGYLGGKAFMKPNYFLKYPHWVGYIFPKNALSSTNIPYKDKHLYGFYSSAAPRIYKNGKYHFKQNILTRYAHDKYRDNGYLTLRFYLNPEGEVYRHDILEYNLNLEPADLNDQMVEEIRTLSFLKENWHPFLDDHYVYYMYLIYRIENGKITEIIP